MDRALRIRGTTVGAAVGVIPPALAVAVVLIVDGRVPRPSDLVGLAWLLGSLGMAGALIGRSWAPRIRSTGVRASAGVVCGVALSATILGALAIATWMAFGDLFSFEPSGFGLEGLVVDIAGRIALLGVVWLAGLVLYGLPSLVLTIPLALIWWWFVDPHVVASAGGSASGSQDPSNRANG